MVRELPPHELTRHALQERIEHAKSQLVADLNRVSTMAREVAGTTGKRLMRVVAFAGLVVVGLIAALLERRRRRQRRLQWK